MSDIDRKTLFQEVAAELAVDPEFAARGGQKRLGALIDFHPATISSALLHPESRMSGEMIKALAAARPDRYGWALARLKTIEYPDCGAATIGTG